LASSSLQGACKVDARSQEQVQPRGFDMSPHDETEDSMRMEPKQSSIALGLPLAVAVSLVLAACGGGGGTSAEQAPQAPAARTAPAAGQADPLEGEWRAEVSCQASVRAVQRRLSAKQMREQGTNWKDVLRGFGGKWSGVEPTKDDPCHGALGTMALLARFAEGNLALLNAESGELGAQARYELVDDHTISINESEDALCAPCPVRWTFDIAGDELTFRVQPGAHVLSTWEAAPWVRVR
jgi:hypothetical protein